jgi:hypothetical protein
MDSRSKIYLPRYNLPIHMATLSCPPEHYDVMPLCTMVQGCLIASRICSILVSTNAAGDFPSTARNL